MVVEHMLHLISMLLKEVQGTVADRGFVRCGHEGQPKKMLEFVREQYNDDHSTKSELESLVQKYFPEGTTSQPPVAQASGEQARRRDDPPQQQHEASEKEDEIGLLSEDVERGIDGAFSLPNVSVEVGGLQN